MGNKMKYCTSLNKNIFSALILVPAGSKKSYFKTFLLSDLYLFYCHTWVALQMESPEKKEVNDGEKDEWDKSNKGI